MQTSLQLALEEFTISYKAVYVFDIPTILRGGNVNSVFEIEYLISEGLRRIGVPIVKGVSCYPHITNMLTPLDRCLLETYLYKVVKTIPIQLWEKEMCVRLTKRAMVFFFI